MAATMSGPAGAEVTGALRDAILDAARQPAASALAKPVRFKVEQLKVSGDWAFLFAEMQGESGRPIDYTGTKLAEAAAHGAVSRSYAALLKRKDGTWTVVDHAIGPTDLIWAGWSKHHGAPPALFEQR